MRSAVAVSTGKVLTKTFLSQGFWQERVIKHTRLGEPHSPANFLAAGCPEAHFTGVQAQGGLPYLLFRHEILEIVERDTPISRAMAALSCPSALIRSASWR